MLFLEVDLYKLCVAVRQAQHAELASLLWPARAGKTLGKQDSSAVAPGAKKQQQQQEQQAGFTYHLAEYDRCLR
jgi:hypothetical protein